MEIRTASVADAEAILEIYAPYVRDTAVSFEYEVPDIEEFRERIRHTLESLCMQIQKKVACIKRDFRCD